MTIVRVYNRDGSLAATRTLTGTRPTQISANDRAELTRENQRLRAEVTRLERELAELRAARPAATSIEPRAIAAASARPVVPPSARVDPVPEECRDLDDSAVRFSLLELER